MIKQGILVYSIIVGFCINNIQNIPIDMKYDISTFGYIDKFEHSNKGSIQEITNIVFFEENREEFVYFGRKSCRHCLKFDDILEQALDNHQIKIYLFDTEKWREDSYFHNILKQYKVEYVPYFIKTSKEGEIEILNLTNINDYENSLSELEKFIISNI